MKKIIRAVIAFIVFGLAGSVQAEPFDKGDLVEAIATGEINWSRNLVRATGRGVSGKNVSSESQARLMAKRAAKVDALRNLMETVGKVRIDSTTTVEKAAVSNDSVTARIKGLVKGAIIVDTRYLPDGSAEVVVQAPITGVLVDTFFSDTLSTESVLKKGAVLNTGLVVDAKGIGAKPVMAPKIVDESGTEVYSARLVNREYAVKHGLAEYSRDVPEAKERERVRSNPLVVKALRTATTRGNEIIISNSDSQGLKDRSNNTGYLEEAKVVIVMD